jgi:micrococcal nuclease
MNARLLMALAAIVVVIALVQRGHAGAPHTPAGEAGAAASGSATVTHVTDGDTVWLSGVGKVRLIGIDTPEVYGHVDCYGPQASAYTDHVLAPGTRVRYEVGRETHDVYGRTLAYLWLEDGRMFNELLAEGGYARPLTIPPNDEYARLFAAAAQRARAARRGLWGSC